MELDKFFKKYVYPVAMMTGGIIGVGFFSLPYVTTKVGIWPMMFYSFALLGVIITIHLIFAEISRRTPDFKRFPGFAKHYLGKPGEIIAFVSTILGAYGTLLAYLIIGSGFLKNLVQPILGGSDLLYIMIYFVLVSAIIAFDVKVVSKFEFWILSFLFLSIVAIYFSGVGKINVANLFVFDFNFSNLFLPYGAILFSLWGVSLIPEAEEMLRRDKRFFKETVVISTLIPAIFYLFFIFLIISITGSQTTESAFDGLANFLGSGIMAVVFLAGLLTTISAFISQGLTLKKVFMYDLGIKKFQALIITCFVPLLMLMIGFNSFISVVSLIGGVLLSINGILILLMYKKIRGRLILIYPLMLIFCLGFIYEMYYFLK